MITLSIIKKSQLEGANRLDAEYYQPEYLSIDEKISKNKYGQLDDLSEKISDGTHFTPIYRTEGIPFISALNVTENWLDLSANFQYISKRDHNFLYKRCDPREGDILLRKVGVGPRWACVVPEGVSEFSIFVSVAQVRSDVSKVNPFYLSTFINSSYGQQQLIRFNKGISQPDLHLEEIKRLRVPLPSVDFQLEIEQFIRQSWKNLHEADLKYKEAENLLLEKLGLTDFQTPDDLTFVVNFSEVQEVNRMDADYFQPKYRTLISKIRNKNFLALSDVIKDYSTGYTFKSENYQEDGIPLIRINNIKKGYLDLTDTAYLTEKDYLLSPKDVARPGDIVLSMSGTIGTCTLIPSNVPKSSINQRILRFRSKNINADYLVLLLNSIVGQYQLERIGTGGVQTNISYKDIRNIIIPILPTPVQEKIADLVKKSHEARKKSKELLEEAKRKVEEMIEKGGD